jgi:RND superfamily putative drug exporter
MQDSRNIAARAGRWSAQHRKTAIVGWLVFVIAAFMVGKSLGTDNIEPGAAGAGESGAAQKTTLDAFPKKSAGMVLVQGAPGSAGEAEFRAAVTDVVTRLRGLNGIEAVKGPYAPGQEGKISADRSSAIVDYEIPGDSERAKEVVDEPLAAVAAVQQAHPGLTIGEFGDASLNKQVMEKENSEISKATMTSLPFTLLILLFAFGALVAAGVPLLLAITAILATMGLLGPVSQISPINPAVVHVVTLIGLAVGVDYSLFYLRRMREERRAGRSNEDALAVAAATSGRAVLISGLTVMVAMAGMYFGGVSNFTAFATGTILVVAVAVLGSLTVLPALLSALGDKLDRGRPPFVGRIKRRLGDVGIWSRIVDRVLRRPLLAATLSAGFLAVLALPTLGMHTALPGIESLPRDVAAMQTYDRIQAQFPAESMTAVTVVEADDVTAAPVRAAIAELGDEAAARPGLFEGPAEVEDSPGKTVATVALPIAGNGSDAPSNRALDALREEIVPATVGGVDGVEANVSGPTAAIRDFNDAMKSHLPYVFGFVLLAAFLLLLVTFRSLVIPIKAIVLNLLSVAASYGVLVWLFQDGHGESLFGFESTGAITAWLPLFLFVILFGLSMDYHVLILSRIRELHDGGMSTRQAVAEGVKDTAGVVSTAALVMVGVFAMFVTVSNVELKQMGVGLAVAVLLDATIVRGVLLPASMSLLGERNWWLPRRLGRLSKPTANPGTGDIEAARA